MYTLGRLSWWESFRCWDNHVQACVFINLVVVVGVGVGERGNQYVWVALEDHYFLPTMPVKALILCITRDLFRSIIWRHQ